MSTRILLVEDEAGVAMVVTDLLVSQGYEVETSAHGDAGLALATQNAYDLLILDLMLPGRSGLEICNAAREHGFDGGILLLTARGEVNDRVLGLKTGADDYLVKPYDAEELLARVEALLRRVHKAGLTPVSRLEFGDVTLDFIAGEFRKSGRPLEFAAKELQLLKFLVNHREQVVSREEILKNVWSEQAFITPRTVDVHVSWLRQKIEDDPQKPRFITTVRGNGYSFRR